MSDQNDSPVEAAVPGGNPSAETADTTVPEMTTLLGGEEMDVTHVPPEALDAADLKRLEKFQPLLGTTERVKVRQVLVSLMPRFGNAILYNNEAAAIEIYCAKEAGWADTLTLESVNAVADKGLEINLPFFGAWFHRQAKAKNVQTPQAMIDLEKKLKELEKTITESVSRVSANATPTSTS